jgi:opacity protein-like surface antigen
MLYRFLKLWVVILIVLLISVVAVAKEYTVKIEKEEDDESLVEIYHRPTISLCYGFSKYKLKDLNRSFANPGLAEIKLGFSSKEPEYDPENIFKYDYLYFSLTNMSTDLGGESNTNKIESDMWRLGLGWEDGYGYGLGKSSITLFNSSGIGWSELKVKDKEVHPSSDIALLSLWDDSFRFGTRTEGGVKIQFMPILSFDAGYERAVVFSRFVFWEALFSMALEDGAQFLLDKFVDQIGDSSPYAVPVVSFFLKNGFSYGIYELRKDKMNWPFDSAPPLCSDSFKFGLSFVF